MPFRPVKKDEPLTPRVNYPKKEESSPSKRASERAEHTPTEPADSSDDEAQLIIKKKQKRTSNEDKPCVSASTRVLRNRSGLRAPPHQCDVEIPPHPLHQNSAHRKNATATSTQAGKIDTAAAEAYFPAASASSVPGTSAHAANTTAPRNRAVGAVRPETYFWPVTTVMRRKVQKFIENQRDALTSLEAELLVTYHDLPTALSVSKQAAVARRKMQDFIDTQRGDLTAMHSELVVLHHEHEAEQKKLRREVLRLD